MCCKMSAQAGRIRRGGRAQEEVGSGGTALGGASDGGASCEGQTRFVVL